MIVSSTKVGPGSGLVSRRRTALLFVPEASSQAEELLGRFVRADDGGVMPALATHVVDAKFELPAFVAIAVGGSAVGDSAVHIRVFGDVAVTTTLPSVPMLSGAGSGTWVDHTVTLCSGGEIRCGVDVDHRTDVVCGTVLAGGFALKLDVTTSNGQTLDPDEVAKIRPKPAVEEIAASAYVLRFDDNTQVDVATSVVLGRKPLVEDIRDRAVPIAGDRVSRTHLRAHVKEGRLWVTDLASRNGSAVIRAATGEPESLPENKAIQVEPGDRVVVGSAAFVVVRESDDE